MVIYYAKRNMSIPVFEFLDSVKASGNKKLIYKITRYIDRLNEYGLALKEPYIKYLKNGIWELRPGNARILFFTDNNSFIMLNGFIKKTNKTPTYYIDEALKYKTDFLERK